ncbi:single-stranded DNA-binding protein [Aneurinibacillus aneurinilyticus]|uniref:Single-stranded DNA-binding protein n=1 Tax=Aneurinibacillus aneurinilyticus TaxID=1391 RepID=A0A848D2I2_ANEAE|nr:single-stranded DNA-binding protein [Aneurinibacillus aneurinilyticus]NMF00263.1 single-stranded DNA-binding protein [Aneurinibacillus aneurinilyticus]
MLNRAVLVGRLTADPILRYTQGGTAVGTFTLAIDRRMTNQNGEKETDFIPVVVWGKTAEASSKYLAKGRQAAVDGRIQVRSYENNEGQRVRVTEVVAEQVQFLGGNNGQQNSNGQAGKPPANDNPFASDGKPIDISDDDLPF